MMSATGISDEPDLVLREWYTDQAIGDTLCCVPELVDAGIQVCSEIDRGDAIDRERFRCVDIENSCASVGAAHETGM